MDKTRMQKRSLQKRRGDKEFEEFKDILTHLLSSTNIQDLAVSLKFPKVKLLALRTADSSSKLMVKYMAEANVINPNDISHLLNALEDLHLDDVRRKVLSSFRHEASRDVEKTNSQTGYSESTIKTKEGVSNSGDTKINSQKQRDGGFGQFVIHLRESLTLENKIKVATVLQFPAAQIDDIAKDTTNGHVFTQYLQEKCIITPTDISLLIDVIQKAGLHGIAENIKELYNIWVIRPSLFSTTAVQAEATATNASRSTRRVYEVSDPPAARGFGRFVFELKESFTVSNAVDVATVLELTAAQRDRIGKDTDGHIFADLLQEKGIISPTDISRLIVATRTVGLQGIADEVQESFSRNVSSNRLSPHINTEFQRKKEQFLKDIKETYEGMYNGVQPVPYIREKMLCVDQVFIDSGIEYLKKQGFSTSEGTWEKLDSYNSIFTDPRLAHAMVYILLGEPGYGKSTLALQFAYDWCNRCPDSPLKDEEMLIFLQLRYLKGGMPLAKAIKRFLLPSDSTLSKGDISSIIQDCKSVVIIFDGFDEYASQGDEDDVMKILARQMLRNCKVVLTTRPSSTPPRLSHKTEQLRLTGFDDQARERYVLKAVVDGDSEAAAKILQRLQQSPVFADICQVSLFFVMFAHMTHERDMSVVVESVTSFFRYVVSSFYEHKQIRAGAVSATVKDMHTAENDKLYKFAFESLRGKDKKLVWEREAFIKLIGEPLYNELVETGMLVEENVVEIVDDPGTSAADHIYRKTDVSFYHKLLCEWYAAHYVADFVNSSRDSNLPGFFEGIDPFDLQYVYRIACGLNPAAADKIIQYLHSIEGGDKFAILCILEQTGDMENIKETIRQICFEGLIISGYDSLLLQRSTMQLLEIAARYEIPIEYVILDNCLQSVDLSTSAIRTTSGLALTSRIPVKVLWVNLSNRDVTKDEAIDILQFVSMCPSLRMLRFVNCVPPRVFTNMSTLSSLKSKDVKVRWILGGNDEPNYILNLQTGRWENDNDGSEPTEEEFERRLSKRAEARKGWTEEVYKGHVERSRELLREQAEEERAKVRGETSEDGDGSDDDDVSEKYSDTT